MVLYIILASIIGQRLRTVSMYCPPIPNTAGNRDEAPRSSAALPVTLPHRAPAVGILAAAMSPAVRGR
jgi:hypothetical protein